MVFGSWSCLLQSEADNFEDPTMLLAGDQEKELNRAIKTMGIQWVNKVLSLSYFSYALAKLMSVLLDQEGVLGQGCHGKTQS